MRGGQRSVAVLVVLLTAAVALSVLHNSGASLPVEGLVMRVVAPIRGALSGLASGISNTASDLGRLSELQAENEALRAQAGRLEASVARMQTAERENVRLREALDYVQRQSEFVIVTARAVGRDSLDVLDTLVIDRGAADGVRVGMPVLANGNLTGRVTGVTDHSADVLPIHSPTSSVNVVVQREDQSTDGILDGAGAGVLVMRRIDSTTSIAVGDLVVTSGLGGGFPSGIAVGRIAAITETAASLFRQARVEPLVDMVRLDIVQVVAGQSAGS